MDFHRRRSILALLHCALLLCLFSATTLFARSYKDDSSGQHKKEHHKHHATRRIHSAGLGEWHSVPYAPHPDATSPATGQLRIRPLIVDGRLADWTTGEPHMITAQTFTVQQVLRVNNALPADPKPSWIWQLGPWLLANRSTGHVATLHLPDFYPTVSEVVWFQNYAAYCGLKPTGQFLYGIVFEVGIHKPLAAQKIAHWSPVRHPEPACAPALWQIAPLRVSLQPTGGPATMDQVEDGFATPYQPVAPATPAANGLPSPQGAATTSQGATTPSQDAAAASHPE